MEGTVNIETHSEFNYVSQGLTNKGGCPITSTWFVENKNTNYQLVNELYNNNVEIAVHPLV